MYTLPSNINTRSFQSYRRMFYLSQAAEKHWNNVLTFLRLDLCCNVITQYFYEIETTFCDKKCSKRYLNILKQCCSKVILERYYQLLSMYRYDVIVTEIQYSITTNKMTTF
mgnify:CR=1 FL=1